MEEKTFIVDNERASINSKNEPKDPHKKDLLN